MITYYPLNKYLTEYTEKNSDNKYRPVAVGRYGIRTRESIYSKELAKDYSKNKLIYQNTLTVGMGAVQIDIGVLTEDTIYSVSPAYHTYRIEGIDADYLKYCLECRNQDMFVRYVKKGSRQGKTIDLKRWLAYEIPVCSEVEQRQVVEKIDYVNSLIEASRAQLAKLDELVKARFVEMFELHSWPQYKAGIFMDDMRNGVSPSNTGTYKAHVLTLSAITQGAFDRNAWKEGVFDCIPSEDKRVSACDFYMCRGNGNRNLVGSGVYSKENLYDLVFPDTVIAARVDTNMVRLPFLCEAWKRPAIRSQIEAGARTTNGTFKINQKVIANIDISIPPIELQNSFVAFVEQTDKSKLVVQQSLEKLETLKKSLMQQYFG